MNNKYVFTGKPCKNGHIGPRYKKNRSCVECLHQATSRWKKDNREHQLEYDRQYRSDHPGCKSLYENKRRAVKLGAEGSFTQADIDLIWVEQQGKCAVCGCELSNPGYHKDHKIPLSRGGSNWPINIQLLCSTDNLRKNTKTDVEYLGRLFA